MSDFEVQGVVPKRIEYEKKIDCLQGEATAKAVTGGLLSTITAIVGAKSIFSSVENIADCGIYSNSKFTKFLSCKLDNGFARIGLPIAALVGIAGAGVYLTTKLVGKSYDKKIEQLNNEYKDVLTQEETKEHSLDVES